MRSRVYCVAFILKILSNKQYKKQSIYRDYKIGGEMGIRTPETALTVYTISNRAPSASSSCIIIIIILLETQIMLRYNKNIGD